MPKALPFPPAVTLDNMFTVEELDRLEEQAASAQEGGGIVHGDKIITMEARRSKIKWVDFGADNSWLYERISEIVGNVNLTHYRFDLSGMFERLQLTRYEAEDRGHYDWHQDYGAPVSRKLSLTLQLTEPDRYDGGVLQIMSTHTVMDAAKTRGHIVVFPAYQMHRVTPVERGVRHSLVAWITGPPFR